MSNASLIRFEDRENIFKTVLQHHNYSHIQPMFKFDLRRRLGSTLSLRSDKADFDRRIQLLQTPRRSSGSVRKFIRRGSSALFKPSRTNSLHNQQNMFNDDVRMKLCFEDQLIFPVFRSNGNSWKLSWTCPLQNRLFKTKVCWGDCRLDAKVLQCWLVKWTSWNSQRSPSSDWRNLSKYQTFLKSPSR